MQRSPLWRIVTALLLTLVGCGTDSIAGTTEPTAAPTETPTPEPGKIGNPAPFGSSATATDVTITIKDVVTGPDALTMLTDVGATEIDGPDDIPDGREIVSITMNVENNRGELIEVGYDLMHHGGFLNSDGVSVVDAGCFSHGGYSQEIAPGGKGDVLVCALLPVGEVDAMTYYFTDVWGRDVGQLRLGDPSATPEP